MMTHLMRMAAGLAVSVFGAGTLAAGDSGRAPDAPLTRAPEPSEKIDLSEPTLFVVGYAHLDTQWRWTYIDTIREFIPNTLNHNFALFEKYPSYVFNFGGSRRYEMMKEYYPQGYEKMREYVKAGRWFPCGSSVDENDANVPSAESQIRHALYGNRFFRRELGIASDEFMLPDCFGFPAGLPSVLAHCGIKGFSTQKLTWNAVVPIPFKVGVWEGPDGRSVIAALDPGSYSGDVRENLADSDGWFQRIKNNGDKSGLYTDYHYYGTGDVGGAPKEASVAMIERSVKAGESGDARIRIISDTADAMFHAISDEQARKLPRYTGELELTQHSAGSVTSQAYMKRWNRKNELLADAAEKAAVGAWWLGAGDYPADRLQRAWELVLGSQMHDILPGTSVPLAYNLSWNDEVIAANQFGAVLTDAAGAVISKMDTTGEGEHIVVYNPLSWERRGIVEARVNCVNLRPEAVIVTGPDGNQVPAQILETGGGFARVAFVANAPSIGYAAYSVDLRPFRSEAKPIDSSLTISDDGRTLENERYVVTLDGHGDVRSIMDKQAGQELLSAPARIGLFYENPSQWPAWNQDWSDRLKPATSYVGDSGPVSFKVVENGPARVAVEVTRQAEGSTFTQRIALGAGSQRVEFDTKVDWNTRERSVRAAFPLTATNPEATYDVQVGAIQRGNRHETQYEYGFQQWFDLTDNSGSYGTTVMCDSKYGTDKPDDNTVRLTLLYTPGVRGGYPDQASQDLGRHHILYAVQGHEGDWRDAQSYRRAAELNAPMIPFQSPAHEGALGRSFSLVSVSDDSVSVQAVKKAEDSDEVIVRLREQSGHDAKGVKITAGRKILAAREVDGQERPMGEATVTNGALVTDLGGYELRAYALTLAEPSSNERADAVKSEPLTLRYDTDVMSTNQNTADGAMGDSGRSYPAEQMPGSLTVDAVAFTLADGTRDGANNAISAAGQRIKLPESDHARRLYLLVASDAGDIDTRLGIGKESVPMHVQSWGGFVGQWDSRQWPGDTRDPRYPWGSTDITGLVPGFIKDGELAWYVSHQHIAQPGQASPDAFYEYSYVYKVGFDVPIGSTHISLPDDQHVKVLAITLTDEGRDRVLPAAPLFDTLKDHVQGPPTVATAQPSPQGGVFDDAVEVKVQPGMYWQAGSFYYTTDGSDPTTDSRVYDAPIVLTDSATVKVAARADDGTLGPVASSMIRVNDKTAPSVTSALGLYESTQVKVAFSEPVAAAQASDFTLEPAIDIRAVTLDEGGRSATITLARAPAVDQHYSLSVANIKDTSPAHNTIKPAKVGFDVPGPVFTLKAIGRDQYGQTITAVPGLPTGKKDHWTINVFVRMDKQPTNHTILVGFGSPSARVGGQGRFISKFANGVHLWSHNADAPGSEQYDLGRWQMITATFDGSTIRIYKDAELIGERRVGLSDDENSISIAPLDPWDERYQFEGELSGLSIWDSALGQTGIEALLGNGRD